MERFGFVGLSNAGKSSLYNALAGGGVLAAPHAFATTAPNVGVARVPDDRLEQLATMSASRKVCLLYTSPSPRDLSTARMPSSA